LSSTLADGFHRGQAGVRVDHAPTHFKEVTLKKVVNVSRYYFFNGQRIALRRDNVVQYVLGDHLGSTTLVLDQNGAKVDEIRYYPYGAERWPLDGTFPTDYRFTGQKYEAGVGGLYQMGARW
jgi:hypothetical protein